MKSLLEQRLWKRKLVAGVPIIVLGGIVLACPGPSILVASTLFGVYLLLHGFTELFTAFTLPGGRHSASVVHQWGAAPIPTDRHPQSEPLSGNTAPGGLC